MLNRLTVKNLAVVEAAEVEFGPGLNVITGETGAGKSVLMSALDLVLGGRAEALQVREGAKEAEVEALFGDTSVRRTVTAEGRSRAWVNDESVTIGELKELGLRWVDIHGPNANQQLLESAFQLAALDALGGVRQTPAFTAYAEKFAEWQSVQRALEALKGEVLSEDEIELLRYQVNEIESAALGDEDETLSERHTAAAHAEELIESASAVTEALGGERSVAELLIQLNPQFKAMSRHLPEASEWVNELEEITVRVQELSRAVADRASSLEGTEEDLAELDARLTLVNRLKRKYGASVSEILAKLAAKRERLETIEHRAERLEELNAQLTKLTSELTARASALTQMRSRIARKLTAAVTAELHDLGFLQAKFAVALAAQSFEALGSDLATYMFEPNPGELARPLAEIASSGEIARVMLALKTVLAAAEKTSTMVFDEIDANIGGEVGRVVGEKLRKLSKRHQVIAITHLPQSAVFGERHFKVAKSVKGGRTRTGITVLTGADRVAEIARMLGGEKLTSVVKKHAEELLQLSC